METKENIKFIPSQIVVTETENNKLNINSEKLVRHRDNYIIEKQEQIFKTISDKIDTALDVKSKILDGTLTEEKVNRDGDVFEVKPTLSLRNEVADSFIKIILPDSKSNVNIGNININTGDYSKEELAKILSDRIERMKVESNVIEANFEEVK